MKPDAYVKRPALHPMSTLKYLCMESREKKKQLIVFSLKRGLSAKKQ
jgi:hypothetical protein